MSWTKTRAKIGQASRRGDDPEVIDDLRRQLRLEVMQLAIAAWLTRTPRPDPVHVQAAMATLASALPREAGSAK